MSFRFWTIWAVVLVTLGLVSFDDVRSKKIDELIWHIEKKIDNLCKTEVCKAVVRGRLKEIGDETEILAINICPEFIMPEGIKDQADCIDIVQKFLLLRIIEILSQWGTLDSETINKLKEDAQKFIRKEEK